MALKKIKTIGGAMPRRSPPAPRNFTELNDCPSSYTGKAGQLPVVNATETALEFKTEAVIDRHDVQCTNVDTTPDFLSSKISAGTGITKTILNPAANEQVQISLAAHDLAGALHNADTITNLNSKLSDGDVISTKAAEISALTAKGSPTSADFLMIEDAADGDKKKKITIANLPAAAPAAHDLAGALHNADTITNLNSKLSDGDVITTKPSEITALAEDTAPLGTHVFLTEQTGGTKKKVLLSTFGFPRYIFYADQLASPNNADWTVNALAAASADPSNNALVVRAFDDTTQEGVGFSVEIPSNATNIILDFRSRAATAPGAAKGVKPKLYCRQIADNTAIGAWDAGTLLTTIDIPTNARFQFDSQTIALATLSLTAGNIVQFELTRVGTDVLDTLSGDWLLLELRIRFS